MIKTNGDAKAKKEVTQTPIKNKNPAPQITRKIISIIIIGIVLCIIGLIIIFGYVNIFYSAKTAEDLKGDWDEDTLQFKSYKPGDNVEVTGKIHGIIETKKLEDDGQNVTDEILIQKHGGKYIYVLEHDLQLHSNQKLGEQGDTLIFECEISERVRRNETEEILSAKSSNNPLPFIFGGGVFLIFGIIIIWYSLKARKAAIKRVSKPYRLSEFYETTEAKDQEAVLIQFLHKKGVKEQAATTSETTKIMKKPIHTPTKSANPPSPPLPVRKLTKSSLKPEISDKKLTSYQRARPQSRAPTQPPVPTGTTTQSQVESQAQAQLKHQPRSSELLKRYEYLKNKDDEMVLYHSMHTIEEKK
ncbi:hypothetical protein [[Eubacterium] cellulosolvens]